MHRQSNACSSSSSSSSQQVTVSRSSAAKYCIYICTSFAVVCFAGGSGICQCTSSTSRPYTLRYCIACALCQTKPAPVGLQFVSLLLEEVEAEPARPARSATQHAPLAAAEVRHVAQAPTIQHVLLAEEVAECMRRGGLVYDHSTPIGRPQQLRCVTWPRPQPSSMSSCKSYNDS
jgi:hypothetical protein